MRLKLAILLLSAAPVLADDVTIIDPAAFFPEGPVMLDGKLYYAQYSGAVVSVWDGAAKSDIWKTTKANLGFIGVLTAVLLLCTYVPWLSLVLIHAFYGG